VALRGDIRASDADRDAAAFRLREHYAAGRLSLAEFQQRLAGVYQAPTRGDLGQLTSDLPYVGPAGGLAADRCSPAAGRCSTARPEPGPYSMALASQAARDSARRFARAARRLLLGLGAAAVAVSAAAWLVSLFVFHSGLLAAALLVLVALAGAAAATAAALAWMAVRMWRRGAWLEALPLLAGQPWLSRALWAARVLWTGRALWRLRGRLPLAPRA
jgi:Domain of unknown function (DUF1707)